MARWTVTRALLPLCCALALGGCAGDEPQPGSPPPPQGDGGSSAPQGGGASNAEECGLITVPGHEAMQVRAGGAGCDTANALVEAAVGKGRAAYEARGFRCEPSEAGGGDTNYRCTKGSAKVTFRYGAQ